MNPKFWFMNSNPHLVKQHWNASKEKANLEALFNSKKTIHLMKATQFNFLAFILFQVLFLGSSLAYSQSNTGFFDNFSNNKNKWFVGKGKDYDNRIENGQYHMYCKKQKG